MVSSIFEQYVRKLDMKFHLQDKKIALIVSNCLDYPRIEHLKAVKLVFSPPNTHQKPN